MPVLTIDNIQCDVKPGTKVIEAAEQVGIMIPRFCFHPALGAVGACRVCAVKFVEGPVKGIEMSCMVDAAEGMVVSTTDAEAVDFRKHVIEWLMLNHPHDCPVCDEGGHCLLQDMTVSGGHGIRRFKGKKRTHVDQDLGPLIAHEMNRCIQCYRCARFYQEYTGYTDLGVMGIGSRVYFGRYKDGTLVSPFSGNLIDICPTGVYTDKPSRYKGRRWDFERLPSICVHCALGCHITVSARYREIVRHEARYHPDVNQWFICDRGRYGFSYANEKDRPFEACVDRQFATPAAALEAAGERLDRICKSFGPDAVACIGSFRSSVETLGGLAFLCHEKNWGKPVCFNDAKTLHNMGIAVSHPGAGLLVSLSDVETADLIVCAGADPINEAPMLAAAMRQARRNGAAVMVLDPRPVNLPFEFDHVPVSAHSLRAYMETLIREVPGEMGKDAGLAQYKKALDSSRRPLVVCGTAGVFENLPHMGVRLAEHWRKMDKKAGLFFVMPGANAFGAAIIGDSHRSFDDILAGIKKGRIKALVLAETDPFSQYGNTHKLEQALAMLDLVVSIDHIRTQTTQRSHVFIPCANIYEQGGTFINASGVAQPVKPVFKGGVSIAAAGNGGHPPRTFTQAVPGGGIDPSWMTCLKLSKAAPGTPPSFLFNWLGKVYAGLAGLAVGSPVSEKETAIAMDKMDPMAVEPAANLSVERPGLALVLTEWTFGTEELSCRSPWLGKVETDPFVVMHKADAAKLELATGDRIRIQGKEETMETGVVATETMARKTIVVPRHRRLNWQCLDADFIDYETIEKIE